MSDNKNTLLSSGLITHNYYGCRCLCHTRRSHEIKYPCACEVEARKELGLPIEEITVETTK